MIKARVLIFLLFTAFLAENVSAVTVYLHGMITDIQGSTGVSGHKVYIKTDFSSPFHYYKTVYTDENGYYADTVQNVPAFPVAFQISTYDCNNEVHLITGLSTNSPIDADFQICVPPYSGCRANFTYESIAGLDYQFTDQSETSSFLLSWKWDFGDPASGANNQSSSQNPHHLYSGSGIYNVKLLIHAINECRDSLVKTVFIRIPENQVIIFGKITNDATGEPISNHPVMINATLIQFSNVVYSDNNGDYSDTIASVPDGIPISVASYDCHNALHSNTVYSSPSPLKVDFNICTNAQCLAGFSAILDSANSIQNTFLFQDLSFGDPNKWTWTFGDGATSHEKNPVHQFTTAGNYRVSLSITKEDSAGAWICFDTTSRIVKTCAYYNLGGLLFAGQFPINNPQPAGDTGVAYLYRSHNRWTAPVDTTYFTYLGYYSFLHVLEGSYIVKASLTGGSRHYNEFLPAYNGEQVNWQTTSSFLLDQNIFDKSINLFASNDSLSGPAMLEGSVIHKDDNVKLPNAEVLLFNNKQVPFRATNSDSDGHFEFQNLPFGTYHLYPEVTGKYGRILQVTVDSAHLIADGLQLEVYEHDVTGISPGREIYDIIVEKSYPNPVTDDFQFWVISPNTINIYAEILTLTGEPVLMKNTGPVQGRQLVKLPLRNVACGMYFLVVKTGEGHILSTQKIIKN
jgi:PKD repeat protein